MCSSDLVADGVCVLVLVPGARRADRAKVATALGASRVRVASGDEVRGATGFEPGGVSPFPRAGRIDVLMEGTLLAHPRVWIAAGSPTHVAELAPSDLQRLTGARTADLTASG